MTDGDMFAHQQRPTWVGVADAAVLDIAARAYADAVNVAAQHGAKPNADAFAQGDIANDAGVGRHPSAGGDAGR